MKLVLFTHITKPIRSRLNGLITSMLLTKKQAIRFCLASSVPATTPSFLSRLEDNNQLWLGCEEYIVAFDKADRTHALSQMGLLERKGSRSSCNNRKKNFNVLKISFSAYRHL